MSDSPSKLIDIIVTWFPILFGFGIVAVFATVIIIGTRQQLQLRRRRTQRRAVEATLAHRAYAKIMDPIPPMSRGRKYEEPLDQALIAARLGAVTGGGTQLDKNGDIAWIGIDLLLADLNDSLQLARKLLKDLGAPAGSVIEYRIEGQQLRLAIV